MGNTTDDMTDTPTAEATPESVPRRMEPIPLFWLGELLIAARKEAGMTQEELAVTLGVLQEVIVRWERERYRSASLERLVRVAEGLGISLQVSYDSNDSHS